MSTTIERIEYGGWPNCYRFSNQQIELIITTDVGPRVIRLGFVGQDNEFHEYQDMLGQMGGNTWRIYGGHRFWHAPEQQNRTYLPDNTPLTLERHGDVARIVQPVESATGIQKEWLVRLWPDMNRVDITHRLWNQGMWPVELAPWALSVMAPGGTAIAPLPPRGSHPADLLPSNSLILWSYTNMADPRWSWGERYIQLRQDAQAPKPQKIGLDCPDGWLAYWRQGHLFIKTFAYQPGATYPDMGCSVEMFTNTDMLELETLGPLTQLVPGNVVEHEESWFLFADVPFPQTEAEIDPMIRARLL